MLDRDDLTFATCYQLAGEIKEEWMDPPEEVSLVLKIIDNFNEPEDTFDSFHEKHKQAPRLMLISEALKVILRNSDGWRTDKADMLKKEIISRIKEYEQRLTEITNPVLEAVYIDL